MSSLTVLYQRGGCTADTVECEGGAPENEKIFRSI